MVIKNQLILLEIAGSYDSSVFIWDIGGRKGTVYELHGHRNKVNSIHYVPSSRVLLSTGEDSNLVVWNMTVPRHEVSDVQSQSCSSPKLIIFFLHYIFFSTDLRLD